MFATFGGVDPNDSGLLPNTPALHTTLTPHDHFVLATLRA